MLADAMIMWDGVSSFFFFWTMMKKLAKNEKAIYTAHAIDLASSKQVKGQEGQVKELISV